MAEEAKKLQQTQSEIPPAFPFPKRGRWSFDIDQDLREFKERDKWIDVGMFAFVSWDWVEPLVQWLKGRRVLEVMAGAGWLARALREKGIEMIATDNGSWPNARGWALQTEVEELDAIAAIQKYAAKTDILLMSWPYMDDIAYKSIKLWEKMKPGALTIYIGEWEGGCTADDKFFKHFEPVEDYTFQQVTGKFVAWWGMHDEISIGKFKKT